MLVPFICVLTYSFFGIFKILSPSFWFPLVVWGSWTFWGFIFLANWCYSCKAARSFCLKYYMNKVLVFISQKTEKKVLEFYINYYIIVVNYLLSLFYLVLELLHEGICLRSSLVCCDFFFNRHMNGLFVCLMFCHLRYVFKFLLDFLTVILTCIAHFCLLNHNFMKPNNIYYIIFLLLW